MAQKTLQDHSAGVIPVWIEHGTRRYLLVQHHAGHWGFPKGHPEKGEGDRAAAVRELAEETGLCDVRLLAEPTFEEAYRFRGGRGRKELIHKTVRYFVGLVDDPAVTCQEAEIADHAWGTYDETRSRLTFAEGRRLLDGVEAALAQRDEVP